MSLWKHSTMYRMSLHHIFCTIKTFILLQVIFCQGCTWQCCHKVVTKSFDHTDFTRLCCTIVTFILKAFVAIHRIINYSQLSNKSTGTMEKNLPKSLAVLTFSCSTIEMNSRFLRAVLLFQWYKSKFWKI